MFTDSGGFIHHQEPGASTSQCAGESFSETRKRVSSGANIPMITELGSQIIVMLMIITIIMKRREEEEEEEAEVEGENE